ncbi:hypothetical protein DFQ05_1978 [Winogradskyella wandonensis]|uniref:LexA-binding, inner membrane-associated hydrolase n=1 Tax=Winogradskyella wandonensis TaxID=1442586 RepID=A0A4R1KNS4_9FLAO|nr:DUF6122 family protein [Winogradskyella wandonensis]TCK66704.1 hypothetical protein DFQ05_1978 [Winogradskyella wandonensis]
MLQSITHYGIHFLGPLIVALLFFKNQWKTAFIIMVLGILIDVDHLLATPIFDANRCSINYHVLHTFYAIAIYSLLALLKKTRLIGLGLLIHILADIADCSFMLL